MAPTFIDRSCDHCGITYTPNSAYSRYCTLRCRDAAARMRRRDRERFNPRGNLAHTSTLPGGAQGYYDPPSTDDDPPPPPPPPPDSTSATDSVLSEMGFVPSQPSEEKSK